MNRVLHSVLSMSKQTARLGIRKGSTYKPKTIEPPAHYDELPLPQGSWKVAYDQKQRNYNTHLVLGLGFFLFTLYYVSQSGVVFFNFTRPPLPYEMEMSGSGQSGDSCEVVVKKC